jgi:hypothetical protein
VHCYYVSLDCILYPTRVQIPVVESRISLVTTDWTNAVPKVTTWSNASCLVPFFLCLSCALSCAFLVPFLCLSCSFGLWTRIDIHSLALPYLCLHHKHFGISSTVIRDYFDFLDLSEISVRSCNTDWLTPLGTSYVIHHVVLI